MIKKLDVRKTIITIVSINIIQSIIILFIVFYEYLGAARLGMDQNYSRPIVLGILIFTIITNSFLTIKYVQSINSNNKQNNMVLESINQIEDLNTTMRGQRHDFMNHLQVVYGLMEMEEYASASDYIGKVYKDIQKVNKVLKTSNPAVNALLQAKLIFAEKRGIKIKLLITTQLKDLTIPAWELCRVIGNIIDNGIYALQSKDGKKEIDIQLFEDLKYHGFRIKNNGPKIPKEIINQIFTVGFTTKDEKGHGMGLAITKEIVEEHGGTILVSSDDNETVFEVTIPRETVVN